MTSPAPLAVVSAGYQRAVLRSRVWTALSFLVPGLVLVGALVWPDAAGVDGGLAVTAPVTLWLFYKAERAYAALLHSGA